MRLIASTVAASVIALAASLAVAAPTEQVPSAGERLRLDESFSIDLDNDCRYNAVVRGDIVHSGGSAAGQGTVTPDLVINADVQCADQATLLLTETVSGRPLTWAELERTIEQRAELTSADGRYGCAYTPDFNLSGAGLNLRAVAYRCPIG